MYVLMNQNGEMFAGEVCGCIVIKRHWTRGSIYQTKLASEKDLTFFDLEGFTVEDLEDDKL